MEITNVRGREIKDSRGNPTLEVFVSVGDIEASFQVPSGASTGESEAYELRDEGTKGMAHAIKNIDENIKGALVGIPVTDQKRIDEVLLSLDGTEHKTRLGGNTMIGVSIAAAKCAAQVKQIPIYEHVRSLAHTSYEGKQTPYLYVNLINGGKHSHSELAFQEYHIVPQTHDIEEALEITDKIINELEAIIAENGFALTKGDEGGYAVATADFYAPLRFLQEAVTRLHLEGKVKFALDVASTSFYNNGVYTMAGKGYSKEELAAVYTTICKDYNLVSIEDPFYEEGFLDFAAYEKTFSPTFFVGDDLTTTNVERVKRAHDTGSIGGLIVKPNQVGTLSETIDAIEYAHANNIKCIVSHRSGETLDTFIADLCVAFNCYGIKTGSPRAHERLVKYNRLVEILS